MAALFAAHAARARIEGYSEGIQDAADMADRWNTGIGEAIRAMP
jgi:hypothetical protein